MKLRPIVVALMLAASAGAAQAGQSCEQKPLTPQALQRGLELARQTQATLDAAHQRDGTRVVVLARAGQDLSAHGLRHSHLGWAYRWPDGTWRVLHKLNDCGTAQGQLYRQGLGVFFLDDLWRDEAAWVVPAAELQAPLHAALSAGERPLRVHHLAYSMVSYAWGTRYQQSNQWALEALAAMLEPGVTATANTREPAQAWLRFKGYQPTRLTVRPLQRLGARVGTAHIAFDDHPNELRFSDRIDTVTVDSVFAWMAASGLSGPVQTLALPATN